MQRWQKLGRIFAPKEYFPWMQTHASVPTILCEKGNSVKILFSTRNRNDESSVGCLTFDMQRLSVINVSSRPILTKGRLGCFDDSGSMACSVLHREDDILLYYIGWNRGTTVPFRNSIGVASSVDGGQTFRRIYEGPILDRTKEEPHFVASSCILMDEGIYKAWYVSCLGWNRSTNKRLSHKYHIKYAESEDGIDWTRHGHVAIDFRDSYEYAISVPRVIKDVDIYRMWFSSRASREASTYRIRYAESLDGKHWKRFADDEVQLNPSAGGWDSHMICYPYIFDHGGCRYMLYNGNDYGRSGFGLAKLINE